MNLNRTTASWTAKVFVLATVNVAANAQTAFLGALNPIRYDGRGLQWTGVSVIAGYASQPFANSGTAFGTFSGPVADYGISSGAGLNRNPHWGSVTLLYDIAYSRLQGRNNQSGSSMSQLLSISFNRKLGRKWSFDVTATGAAMDLEQALFRPAAGSVAFVGATFDDLVRGILAGRGTNSALNAALMPSLLTDSPAKNLLYGSRMLGVTVNTALAFAATSRFSVAVSALGSRAMPLPDSGSVNAYAVRHSLIRTTVATGSLSMNYAISPRTYLGATISSSRLLSNYQDGYNSQTSLSVGRTLSRHLFVQASAGAGKMIPLKETVPVPRAAQWLASAAAGYKTYSHSFYISAARSLGDSFGIGGGTNVTFGGGWNWSRPGRSWAFGSTVAYQRVSGSVFSSPESVQTNASFSKALSRAASVSVNYAHLRSIATVNANAVYPDAYRRVIHSMRVAVHWNPGQ